MGSNTGSDVLVSSLRSITRGASIFVVGKIASNFLKFALNIILSRGLGAGLYGVYAFTENVIFLITIFARLGTGESLLRFLPQRDNEHRREAILGLAYVTTLTASVIFASAMYYFAPLITKLTLNNPLLTDVLRVLAIVLPFNTLSNLTNNVFRALELLEYRVLVENFLTPLLRISFVGIALLIGYSLIGVITAIAVATVLIFLLSILLLATRTSLWPTFDRLRDDAPEFYRYSLPLTFKDIGWFLYYRVDILMVGIFLADSSVGIYQIAVLVGSLLTLPLSAFNQLFPPVASRLYTDGDHQELESIYKTLTRWTFTVALLPAIGIVVFNEEILGIFGSDFTAGTSVLSVIILAQLTNCAVGPSGFLLMMTDHQYLNMANQWIFGLLNVALNYFFIQEFGILGAAIASATVLILINLSRVSEVWYTEGLFPYSINYWKPATAGVIAAGVMIGIETLLNGYILLVTGGGVGGLVFASLLYLFGIEQSDYEFFNQLL